MTDESARVCGINEFFCKGCGVCQAVCPAGAISMRPESDFIAGGGHFDKSDKPETAGELVGF
jgi:ferredoxin